MGTWIGLIAISLAAVSLLVSNGYARAAPAPQSVGNMKRIIIPEKGEPQVTIAPSGAANPPRTNGSSPAGASNPLPGGVPVQSMIGGAISKGGPLPLR